MNNAAPAARAKLCVGLLVLLAFALGCTEFSVIGIETELADAFGASLAEVGRLISVYAIVYAVSTPVLALVTGRFRRFTLLLAYSGVFIAGNALAAFAPTLGVLIASRAVCGLVSGGLLALAVTFLPELVGEKKTSLAVAVVYGAFSVAMVLATSAGKMLASLLGWRSVVYACLALAIAACALVIAFLPHEGATDEPAGVLEQLPLLAEPSVVACIGVFVFGIGSIYVFYGYVTPYLEEFLGLSSGEASLVLLVYGAILFASNMLSGVLDEKFGLKANIAVFLVQAVVLTCMWAVGSAMPAALVVIMVFGLLMYMCSVPCVTLFMRMASERHTKALTLASSLEPAAFNIGISVGTAIGGVVVSRAGLGMVGLVGAVMALAACACATAAAKLEPRHAAGE
ncbi:MFS transporter [Paratractidigestivibacter sp.]|uniref:MFS transporter n=1 Tax=Paratractidigestivibacter sp. TaxID=2847316 RepID=UPI002ABD91A8|nr:MFS transporter [Paratractidigestivibacter sp.]